MYRIGSVRGRNGHGVGWPEDVLGIGNRHRRKPGNAEPHLSGAVCPEWDVHGSTWTRDSAAPGCGQLHRIPEGEHCPGEVPANGVFIGTPGVVSSFAFVQRYQGAGAVDEPMDWTVGDTTFSWDVAAGQWIFNLSTKPLSWWKGYRG